MVKRKSLIDAFSCVEIQSNFHVYPRSTAGFHFSEEEHGAELN